jgi:LAO/AO transport system kinase
MFGSTQTRVNQPHQVEAILAGDMRALGRAITVVQNRDPAAAAILQAVFPYTGRAKKVGITGPPGVGKSTLAGRLAKQYLPHGLRVAVLSMDPSSPFSGGAMLGDQIRMQGHAGIYIRSMATRGHLGGLASATAEVIDLLDAAAFDRILVESMGAGQDEVEITFAVDALLLLMAPGLGDFVQLLKAGLNEVADIFVLNKCDDPAVEGVEEDVRAELELALRDGRSRVPVVFTTATAGKGIASLLDLIEAYLGFLEQTG